MPVQSIPEVSRVTLTFEVGMDEQGKPVTKSQSLSNIKADAPDQAVYDVVNALASLQTRPLLFIKRMDSEQLAEQ